MNSSNKLLIVTTCRDREHHLKQFIPHIKGELSKQNIAEHKLIVARQTPRGKFNQGVLYNASFKRYHEGFDYVCFHDVDVLSESIDYSYTDVPTGLVGYRSKTNYSKVYAGFFGAACLIPTNRFIQVNGYSNLYPSWFTGDDDIRIRFQTYGIETGQRYGRSFELDDESNKQKIQRDPEQWKKNTERFYTFRDKSTVEKRKLIYQSDGLSNVESYINSLEETDDGIMVDLK